MAGKSVDRRNKRRRQPRLVRRDESASGQGQHGNGEALGGSETTDTNETNETTDTNDDEQNSDLNQQQLGQQIDNNGENVINHHHQHHRHRQDQEPRQNQIYYMDQNRNLNLSELSEKDEEVDFSNNNHHSNINNNNIIRNNNNNNHAKIDINHKTSTTETRSSSAAAEAADLRHHCSQLNDNPCLTPLDSRRHDNVSPIESLSSERSGSSDCTTPTANNYGCRSSSSSAAASSSDIINHGVLPASQAESKNATTDVLIRDGSQDSNNDHQRADHDKQVKFHHLQRHVKSDIGDQPAININEPQRQIEQSDQLAKPLATNSNNNFVIVRDQLNEHNDSNDAKELDQGASLVRQLGRRVSLLPQLVARRLSRGNGETHNRYSSSFHPNYHQHHSDDHHQQQQQEHSDENEANIRRYSLPPAPTSMCSVIDSDPDSSCALLSSCGGSGAASSDTQPLATVAGVGGTITTVTRSKTKTAPLPRLVAKNGQVNLFLDNIDRRQYVRDLFTTMIDIKWRYNLMAAAFGFVFSWLFFACVWYTVLYFHNDLEHENDPTWSPCIVNVYSFPAALLFSIETQSTLGFGSRIISVECPGAIVIFCTQLIFGVVVECLIVGMVFAKLSRPTKRSQTIMYSKYATVCLRENRMCLTFRVGDVRSKSHIIGATIRASLVSSKTTKEGEIIPFYYYKLNVIIDDCKDSLLLIWPVTIVHVIDEKSPFYRLNSDQLSNFKFEIITVLEGTVESTGQSIQVRSSYLPSEVKWGYRFEPIVSTHGYGKYAQTIIDYNKFNRIIEVPTPRCSPMDYYAFKEAEQQQEEGRELQDRQHTVNGGELASVAASS